MNIHYHGVLTFFKDCILSIQIKLLLSLEELLIFTRHIWITTSSFIGAISSSDSRLNRLVGSFSFKAIFPQHIFAVNHSILSYTFPFLANVLTWNPPCCWWRFSLRHKALTVLGCVSLIISKSSFYMTCS